ncbi:MAG: translation initiation factor IF-2, partial [Clostridia bacterium]
VEAKEPYEVVSENIFHTDEPAVAEKQKTPVIVSPNVNPIINNLNTTEKLPLNESKDVLSNLTKPVEKEVKAETQQNDVKIKQPYNNTLNQRTFNNRPPYDPNRPRTFDNRPPYDPNRPRTFDNRPPYDPNRPRTFDNRPPYDPNRPRPFDNRPPYDPNRPRTFDNRPPYDPNRPRTFDNRPQFGSQGATGNNFATSRGNSFRKFAPTESISVLAQPERSYGNKNKTSTRSLDEKKQPSKRAIARLNYSNGDFEDDGRTNRRRFARPRKKEEEVFVSTPITNAIMSNENISVKELSEKVSRPAAHILKQLMILGIVSNINSVIDFETAELVCSELGVTLEKKFEQTFEEKLIEESKTPTDENQKYRAPVVTVMGHVDHGKTSILDYIRKSSVASGEAGGITQKIGAYQIETKGGKITFIDTPGHAAFTAMRARGAKITDIAILVVAADDGIMPQTIDAINHIKSAGVPMIVAVNKMDKKDANLNRIKEQLAANGVMPEEWGGDAILVPVSALTGMNMDKLVETILLVADVQNFTANPDSMAVGTVIEAELDKNRGPVASVLIQSGTLRVGDNIVSGITYGKIKAMFDENGKSVKEAGPSTPVAVLGLGEVPFSGDIVYAVAEKLSKQVIEERVSKIKQERSKTTSGVTADEFMNKVNEGKLKALNIMIKADVQGSVEALRETLVAIENKEVKVVCVHSGVGQVSESDLLLAQASNAFVISFNQKITAKIKNIAEQFKVKIQEYKVIYDVVDKITEIIKSMMTIKYEEVVVGHAEIRMLFKLSSAGLVAGSYVTDGKMIRKGNARIMRDGKEICLTTIEALKIIKDDKSEVAAGFECGIKLSNTADVKEGDIIECFQKIEVKR